MILILIWNSNSEFRQDKLNKEVAYLGEGGKKDGTLVFTDGKAGIYLMRRAEYTAGESAKGYRLYD